MGDVVGFPGKTDEEVPHLTGDCFCGACGHEWAGVVPVGTTILECPRCHRMWGALKHAVEPAPCEATWTCNCGERLFWLRPNGPMCRRCGVMVSVWL